MSASRTPQGLIEATRYTIQSPREERHRRRNWLEDSLASQISESFTVTTSGFTRKLPNEACRIVARQLLSLYAAVISRGLFVAFEGKQYISSLSNSPSEHHHFLFCPPKTINRVYTQEDLGITSVHLPSSDIATKRPSGNVPGVWWRYFVVTETRIVHGESDGIKLRRLRVGNADSIAWSVAPPKQSRFEYVENRGLDPTEWQNKTRHSPNRMVAVSCNDPQVVGYSMLWSDRIMMIDAHKIGEDMSFYISQPYTCWLHMPVDRGELITEIYKGRGLLDHDRALGIKTGDGRCFLAGVCSNPARRWTLINRPSQEISQMFYEASNRGINILAFENDHHSTPDQEFYPPLPPTTSIRMSQQDYFYSSSELQGLKYITPCRTKNRSCVTGLLLTFANGHRESVGQVRLDLLTEQLDVSENQTAVLGFRKQKGNCPSPYVAEIASLNSELGNDFVATVHIFCNGKLEWFWTWLQCYVMYEGQESPRPI